MYNYDVTRDGQKYELRLITYPKRTGKAGINATLESCDDYNGHVRLLTNRPLFKMVKVKSDGNLIRDICGNSSIQLNGSGVLINKRKQSMHNEIHSKFPSSQKKRDSRLLFSIAGCSGLVGGPVYLQVSVVYRVTQSNVKHNINNSTDNTYGKTFVERHELCRRCCANVGSKIIIYEQEDGFWKILTETLSITLKGYFKPYYTMGGAFKNWLVDSGFEKYELNYKYTRDGQEINATTLTYPKPTGKAGINQPWRPATDYNGQYVCLQPDDIFTIWYFEDKWQINNAIYAKNFQSDTMASGVLENEGELRFRMNYIPSLAKIGNKPGKVEYRYLNGGFAQVDTSNYTGMALIFNFICVGRKFYANDNNQPVDSTFNPYICFVGKNIYHDGCHYVQGCSSGFASGYKYVMISYEITISYNVREHSHQEGVTVLQQYNQLIDRIFEMTGDLLDRTGANKARRKSVQITSRVFRLDVTTLGDLPDGLFSNITKMFSKLKGMLSKIKNKKVKTKPLKGTMIDKQSIDVPNVTIVNRMPEEIELGIVYNSLRKTDRHDFPAFALSTEIDLPYIQTTNSLTPKFKQYLQDRGLLSVDDAVVQFDSMNSTFSTLRKKNADIINYKIDPDIAHEVLSNMSTSATRSLFSLNVRKQISFKNEFSTPTYNQLIDRILDDGALLDVLGKLDRNSVSDFFQEFLDRMKDMLSFY
uniref:Outer capsid protein VP4 n=1 Tax=Rotavirus B TaxID=28876 RepID=A0A5Q2V4L7_9REOV|nr:outer capsid protein VP4 [Rotavirus B]